MHEREVLSEIVGALTLAAAISASVPRPVLIATSKPPKSETLPASRTCQKILLGALECPSRAPRRPFPASPCSISPASAPDLSAHLMDWDATIIKIDALTEDTGEQLGGPSVCKGNR